MGTTTRDRIIAIAQKAVDRAYDCYAARPAELTGGSIATASASGKDSVANRLAAEERAAAYGGLGDASPVISRVDVQDGPGGPKTGGDCRPVQPVVATRTIAASTPRSP
ncbi:hypothetical protein ACIRPQ_33885 [Streptomyces sp. NPDC101213]|uniref:hypothetical protein n=1 Tax=Streptomyces sp. NPDC101213 TaxID=3366130 RepID=UPI00380AC563